MTSRPRGHAGDQDVRVGIIGRGSVGGKVASSICNGSVSGYRLGAVLGRRSATGPWAVDTIDELLDRSDLVVEAAGQTVLSRLGADVVAAGKDLLILSVGALVDESLRERLAKGPGRLLISTGAIGGLDILRAAMLCAPLEEVLLESRKPSAALVRDWMDPKTQSELRMGAREFELFHGPAREAARRFPQTSNVAATLALATIGLDRTQVRLLASPSPGSRHVIRAKGPSGRYELGIENISAPGNSRTSWVTPFAVIRALTDLESMQVLV